MRSVAIIGGVEVVFTEEDLARVGALTLRHFAESARKNGRDAGGDVPLTAGREVVAIEAD